MNRATGSPGSGVVFIVEKRWHCPACGRLHKTLKPQWSTPLHRCKELHGAWVPFVAQGTEAHIRVNEREDYVGNDVPTTDSDGRPIMSVTTERKDGEDTHIFVPNIQRSFQQ